MSIAPSVSWPLGGSTSRPASMVMPVREPKVGIPEAARLRSGPARPKISASFQIVVDWLPGMISPAGGGMCHRQALGCGSPGA